MTGVTINCTQTVAFTGRTASGVRHADFKSKKGVTGFSEVHKVNPPRVSRADVDFIQTFEAVLVSSTPDQARPTNGLTHQQHPGFTSLSSLETPSP